MEIRELETGDILLFSPEKGSFISWAITFLTGAPVSHAAMFYNKDNETIIEETPPQVKTGNAAERFTGRTIYVRRLKNKESWPITPVLEAATGYLNEAEPYANSNLYLVGLLLIYKKFTPNTLVQKVMIKILKRLSASIIDYINKAKYPGKLPMVCSQFVAQCYDDAGDGYRLHITKGALRAMAALPGGETSVLDQVMARVQRDLTPQLRTLLAQVPGKAVKVPSESDEELCKELKEAFEALTQAAPTEISDELVEAVNQFGQAHYLIRTGLAMAPQMLQAGTVPAAMQFLKKEEDYFVTPGELLSHCTNLNDIGTIG